MKRSVCAKDVLEQSIQGIRVEINKKTWRISGLVERITGSEKRFFKPIKNQYPIMVEALRLHREVKKLKIIKKELQQQL